MYLKEAMPPVSVPDHHDGDVLQNGASGYLGTLPVQDYPAGGGVEPCLGPALDVDDDALGREGDGDGDTARGGLPRRVAAIFCGDARAFC